ncbi:MAG: helix-turn-helix transcriptional regulator [Verrucomicrobiota bacterium]|nr:helix-turn-helix transcriptional regulator [Verrucomicrobiota bacterium]
MRLIKAVGWSQSEAARVLFVTPSMVNQVVNGKAEPSISMLQLLKLSIAKERPDLVYGPVAMQQGQTETYKTKPPVLEEWEIDLIGTMRQLSKEERKLLAKNFKSLTTMMVKKDAA